MKTADTRKNGQHKHALQRITFRTSRELDFFSKTVLSAQIGHSIEEWPAVIVKELVDNGLDACEEHDIVPEITVVADARGITVADNGPGLPAATIAGAMDFKVRVSSRAAYCSPTRGTQGNALKTLLGMPFVLDRDHGRLIITTGGVAHSIAFRLDPTSQQIVLNKEETKVSNTGGGRQFYKSGTSVRVEWGETRDESGEICWPFDEYHTIGSHQDQITSLVRGYSLFNPHLTLTLDWFGEQRTWNATDTNWHKWKPNSPTSPHWYELSHLERLIGAYITHGRDSDTDRTVGDFLMEFDGLKGSKKRTAVMEQAGLKRAHLSEMATEQGMRSDVIGKLLAAMKTATMPVTEKRLGQIGKEHMTKRLIEFGCLPDSVTYKPVKRIDDGIAFVLESAFGYLGGDEGRQIYAGANWSVGIKNPFRSFGTTGEGLDSVLEHQRAGGQEPIVFVMHLAHPRVEYQDHGKSSITVRE